MESSAPATPESRATDVTPAPAAAAASKARVDLRHLDPNQYVEGVYSMYNPQLGVTRSGKPFLKCLLRDASGEVAARHWSFEEGRFAEIETAGFVWIAGHTQNYNGQTQLIVEQIRATDVSEEEMASLLPTTKYDIDAMLAELRQILGTVADPSMRALVDEFLDDEAMMMRFRRAPAAVSLHHAWIGGLLEHTLQLLRLADRSLPLYPELNRDLVLAGLFLHDLGKTAELQWERGFQYSTDGNLIGHIVRGAIWLQVKAAMAGKRTGQKLSSQQLCCLQHIILSHHGLPEHGAARIPSTPEAIFVSQLDDLDAKTQMVLTAAERGGRDPGAGTGFTDKIWALGTRVYRPDPFAGEPGDSV